MSYVVANHVSGKRLELRAGDQRVVVDRAKTLYRPPCGDIRARHRNGRVYLLMGGKQLEMTIPVAIKVGFALAKNGGACLSLGDIVLFSIGGEDFTLLPADAVRIGGVMMLKADKADTLQRSA